MINCPNCGAPLTGHKCEYCGAIIFDFTAIEIGKPVWINFKMGERWVLADTLAKNLLIEADYNIDRAEITYRAKLRVVKPDYDFR